MNSSAATLPGQRTSTVLFFVIQMNYVTLRTREYVIQYCRYVNNHEHLQLNQIQNTHTRLTALCLRLAGWAGNRKVKPLWILLKQETVSGSGISWVICKSAPCFSQHHTTQFCYRLDDLVAQPTAQSTESSTKHLWYTSPGTTVLNYSNVTVQIQRKNCC